MAVFEIVDKIHNLTLNTPEVNTTEEGLSLLEKKERDMAQYITDHEDVVLGFIQMVLEHGIIEDKTKKVGVAKAHPAKGSYLRLDVRANPVPTVMLDDISLELVKRLGPKVFKGYNEDYIIESGNKEAIELLSMAVKKTVKGSKGHYGAIGGKTGMVKIADKIADKVATLEVAFEESKKDFPAIYAKHFSVTITPEGGATEPTTAVQSNAQGIPQ